MPSEKHLLSNVVKVLHKREFLSKSIIIGQFL